MFFFLQFFMFVLLKAIQDLNIFKGIHTQNFVVKCDQDFISMKK